VTLGAELGYVLVQCDAGRGAERFIVAEGLLESIMQRYSVEDYIVLAKTTGRALENLTVNHPFYDKQLPILLGDHVTLDAGTGCVHTAPDHGVDDFNVGRKYGLGTLNYSILQQR
jgi:isoleucyl-tRNA synthetase